MNNPAAAVNPHLLELKAAPDFSLRNQAAVTDLAAGCRLWPLAWALGWLDIRLRYRGSVLGPFWITLSTGVMVGALGYLYSGIFQTDLRGYLPYLSLSLVLWGVISTVITDACTAFTDSENVIRAVRIPFFLFAARILIRNLIVLAHNILVVLVVFLAFLIWPGWNALLVIPGLLVWCIDALALVLLLGTFCARFRDIPPIVASILQIAFFVSPVIWQPEQLGDGAALLPLNPFFDLLEIVRRPLLGEPAGGLVWFGSVVVSLVLCGMAWGVFTRARGRIAFWI